MLSFPCIYGSDLWYRKFRRKDWNLEEIKSRKRREFSNIKFNKGTLTTLNWILRFFRIEHPRGYKIFLSNIFQQYIDIANININIGFFKNCNININIEFSKTAISILKIRLICIPVIQYESYSTISHRKFTDFII